MALKVEASHGKSETLPSSVSMVFCKWRYNRFNLCRDLTRPPHWGVMRIYGWELLAICHHPDKFGDHGHCESGDMFLICYVTSSDQIFEGLCYFMGGSLS